MKLFFKHLFFIILILSVVYFSTAFVLAEPNPFIWKQDSREGLVACFFVISLGYALVTIANETHKYE
jgi:hypothetical protein